MKTRIEQVNENSLLIRFGDSIDNSLPPMIASANSFLLHSFAELVTDTIPAYTTLLVIFDDNAIELESFIFKTKNLLAEWQESRDTHDIISHTKNSTEVVIPVYYAPEVAPDLENLAREKQLSIDQVIQIHSDRTYTVYAIGFAPGFAFLGDVDQRIATPRLDTPRQNIAKGSVGIAGLQTGIYPRPSPGGWNIIGRTPKEMFFPDVTTENLCALKIGDRVRFNPVSKNEFIALGGCLDSCPD